ncbi:MAG: FAD:protein FMN transferase [Alphaproteobacteria bacterium]|nr:FAD:protein FMN transferase [Alphaproteobacteria bacterium]
MIAGERRVLLPRRCVAAPAPADKRYGIRSLGGVTMGTTWRVMLVEPAHSVDPDMLRRSIATLFASIIAAMSTWEASSEISRFNRAPAGTAQSLSHDFFVVLDKALQIAAETNGCFDPTVGSAVCAWGFGPQPASTFPADARHARCRARWQALRLDRASRRVRQPGGVSLDLSAIAKGYAVDRLSDLLRAAGMSSFLAEIGGEFVGRGTKPSGEPWWVFLETPPDGASHIVPTVLALHDLAIASSGDYRRYRDVAGRRLSHLIDPRTMSPASTSIAAVSVVHETCMEADALATALAVMDIERALAFAERQHIAARFVLRGADGLDERLSTAMQAMAE